MINKARKVICKAHGVKDIEKLDWKLGERTDCPSYGVSNKGNCGICFVATNKLTNTKEKIKPVCSQEMFICKPMPICEDCVERFECWTS